MSTPKNPQTATTLEDKARLLKAKDQPLGKQGSADENAPIGWDVPKGGPAPAGDVPLPAGSGHAAATPAIGVDSADEPGTGAAHGAGTAPSPSAAVGGGGGGGGGGAAMQSPGPLGGAAIVMPGVENHPFSPSTAAGAAVPQVPHGGAGGPGPFVPGVSGSETQQVSPVTQPPQQPPVIQPPVQAGLQQPPLAQPALIAGTDTGSVTEDSKVTVGKITTAGQLTVTDPDVGQDHFTAQGGTAGKYGSFTLATDGTWTYSADNSKPEIQSLKAGETRTDNFAVTSADGTTHTVVVTLTGTNDAPILQAQIQTVTEDGTQLTGKMIASDIDIGDARTFASTNPVAGFTLNPDGSYSFDPSDAAYQHLAAGQTQTLTIPVTVTDSAGTTSTQNLSITLTGTNDGATIAGANTGTVTEDTTLKTGGQLTIVDIDDQQSAFQVQTNSAGAHGSFTLATDGTWSYQLNNTDTAVQSLKAGATLSDSLTVQSVDGTQHTISVTIQGSNDAPSLLVRTHAVAEDGTQVTGNARVDDVDTGDTHTFSLGTPIAGFTLNPDGSYSFDPSVAAYQHLPQGQRLNLGIDITVTDGNGASDTQTLFITLTGTNDGAVVSGVDSGAVGEDATLTTGGKLDVKDIDDNQAVFTAQTNAPGTYGSFSLAADGSWTYQIDNTKSEVQALKAGETKTESFVVASADGTTHTVTVTVSGSNDAPLLQAQSQSVTEDGAQLSGHMVTTDIDSGDTQAFSMGTPVAGFTLNLDGSYRFNPSDAAYQHLAAGQTQDLIIPVTVTDSAGATATQNLSITLTGTNDTPAVSGALVDVVTEDGSVVQTHNLPVMDFSKNLDGAVMTMGALATGDMKELSAEFSVISDGQAINSDHHGATFLSYASSVHNNDFYVWRPDNLTICIGNEEHSTGINIDDGGSHRVSVVWSSATGSLDVLVDGVVRHHVDGYQQGYTITGGGTLVLGQDQDDYVPQNGSTPWDAWGFDTPDAFAGKLFNVALSNHAVDVGALSHTPLDQLLHQDPALVANIEVGSNGQIVDTTGHNQLMVYPGTTVQTVAVDSGLSGTQGVQAADGQLQAADVDDGQSGFQALSSTTGTYGSFSMDAQGRWHYQLDNASPQTQALLEGQQVVDRFTVLTIDGTPVTVAITVIGRNDVAVVSGVDSGQVTEDANIDTQGRLTATGDLQVADVDSGQAHFQSATLTGSAGVLTLDASGHWEYHVDNSLPAVQKLGDAQVLNEHFTVNTVDGTQHAITVTIHGKDDGGAVITGTDTGTVTEDSQVTVGKINTSGQLTVTDPDVGQDHFTAQSNVAGSYGSFTLDTAGHWTYAADNSKPEIQHLKAGETKTDSFTVTSADGTTHTVAVTIQGTNDTPSLLVRSHAVAEDGSQVTGNARVDDLDSGDTHSFSLAHPVAGFTLNADGSYSFDPSDATYQHLQQGQKLNLSVDITVTDGSGASDTQPLFISLTGTNDGARISGVDSGAVTEDSTLSTGGKLTVSDIDDHEAVFTAQNNIAGTYGSYSIATDGSWTYQLDNTKSEVQTLKAGETRSENMVVTSADGTTHTVTVTINGKDDGAVIAGTDSGKVIEDTAVTAGKISTSGQLTVTDPDAGQDHFTAQAGTAGSYGSFTLDAQGHWTYSADNKQSTIQQLKAGATLTDTLTVTSADGTTHTVAVTIQGTNDAPSLLVKSHAVSEDGAQLSGRVVVDDVDNGDTHTFSISNPPAGFTLNLDGSYTFDPSDAAYQHLKGGEIQTLTIPVTVTDSAGASDIQPVVIRLTGSNDGAVITGVNTATLTEDSLTSASGKLSVSDIDTGEAVFQAQTNLAGAHGQFNLAADGSWTYALDNANPAIQALTRRDILSDTITVKSADGTTHQINVTIHGTDDGAVITGTDNGTVTEDSQVTAGKISTSGQLTVTDPDVGQDHFTAQSNVAGSYGSFTLDTAGHWTYAADNSKPEIQHLKAGETKTDSFTVTSADGTTHTVAVTIQGTNDTPSLLVRSHAVAEDGSQVTGNARVDDLDSGDTHSFSLAHPVAGFTLNADGSYSFDPSDAAYQHLQQGQKLNLGIDITVTDGSGASDTQPLFITLTGTNDGAVVSGRVSNSLTEDAVVSTSGMLRAGGQLTVADPDTGEAVFVAQTGVSGAGHFGRFSIDASGHYSYTADNTQAAIQQLKVGETLTDRFTVATADGTQQVVTITINGAEDKPVLQAQTHAVTEDGARLTGQMLATDVDAGDTQRFSIAQQIAGFSLNTDGSYSFDPANAAYQHLAAGQTQTLTIPVTVTDSAGGTSTQNLTITVTGTNDAAVIGGRLANFVTEDAVVSTTGMLRAGGQLTVADPDTGEAVFVAQTGVSGAGHFGSFSIDASGHYSYTADNTQAAIQQLKVGETLTDRFTVATADGTQQVVTITINGAEDKPVLQAQTHAVTEDGARLTGQMLATDVDAGDTQRFSIAQQIAGFAINPDGSYSFDPANTAYQHLAAGQTQTLTIPVTVTDSAGATATQNLTLTLTGTNDGARISGTDRGSVTEDGRLTTSGRLTVSDPDSGEAAFQVQSNTVGAHGSFTLAADGSWSYQLNNADPAVQAMNLGQTLADSLVVRSIDGTTHTLNININGTGDPSHLVMSTLIAVEDGRLASGNVQMTNVVPGTTYTYSTTAHIPGFQLNGDGSYSFSPSYVEWQHLKQGEVINMDIPVTVSDGHGGTFTETGVRIQLTGTNDGARIGGDDYETLREDQSVHGGMLEASGHLKISDIDTFENHFLTQQGLHGQYGTLDIDAHGHWTYKADNSQAAIQNLNAGQSVSDTIAVQSVDGTRHNIVVMVGGADEPLPPVLQGPTLIQAPPSNHVLQPHLSQSGDIYQQLIDTFLATNDPAYVAAAHAMQNGDPYGTLSNIELVIDGAGILISDPSGSVSTQIPPNSSGVSSIPLNALINLHHNQGTWVQLFDPHDPTHEVKPWLHDFYDDNHLRVDYLGQHYVNNNAHDTVSQPISVPFYAPPGGGSPAPAPVPPTGADYQHDDPSAFLGDPTEAQDVIVIHPDHPAAAGHAGDGMAQAEHAPGTADGADPGVVHAASDIAPVANTAPVTSSPVDDYLQFAANAQPNASDGAAAAGGTPVDHYLAVAGVDQASITLHAPDLPPTDVLLDIHSAADAGALPDQAAVDDAALAAVPVEVPHQPQDDPQHHGA